MEEKTNLSIPSDGLTTGQRRAKHLKEKYGDDFFSNIAKKVKNRSAARPFRDNPGSAERAVRARWRRSKDSTTSS